MFVTSACVVASFTRLRSTRRQRLATLSSRCAVRVVLRACALTPMCCVCSRCVLLRSHTLTRVHQLASLLKAKEAQLQLVAVQACVCMMVLMSTSSFQGDKRRALAEYEFMRDVIEKGQKRGGEVGARSVSCYRCCVSHAHALLFAQVTFVVADRQSGDDADDDHATSPRVVASQSSSSNLQSAGKEGGWGGVSAML
jgi:hypothetical protein